MLTIRIDTTQSYDETMEEFVEVDGVTLDLEHSLVSLSKWESIFEKPFLGAESKTSEETLAYVRAMVLTPNIAPEVFDKLSPTNFEAINSYIEAKMSATWFSEAPGAPRSRDVITAELIYYWMTVFQIPFECENWHLNRLFNLIRICNIKQAKPKKMSRNDVAARNRELNAQRKSQLGSKG
jgi:hypothetical protein